MVLGEDALAGLGFERVRVPARGRLGVLTFGDHRAGVYALHFADGRCYVGKTTSIAARLRSHQRRFHDIVAISFKRMTAEVIGREERHTIRTLEASGIELRNIYQTHLAPGPSALDEIIGRNDQERWLVDMDMTDPGDRRSDDEFRRARYADKYRSLMALPFKEEVISVLREYARWCLPFARSTEEAFWVCSCLPKQLSDFVAYTRVTVYRPEVVSAISDSGELYFSFHLTESPLQDEFGMSLAHLEKEFPGLTITDHIYRSGGDDQVSFEVSGADGALDVIGDQRIRRAIRHFNLQLMRKGPPIERRSHCFQFADRILA